MGVFIKLLGLATAVGAGYASVKIAKKYDENKQKEVMEDDFDSVTEASTAKDVKKAVGDVYNETSEKVKKSVVNTAENIGIDTDEFGKAFCEAGTAAVSVGRAVANASVKVAGKVMEEVPVVIDSAKTFVGGAVDQVKDTVNTVSEKIHKAPTDAEVHDDAQEDCEVADDETEEAFVQEEQASEPIIVPDTTQESETTEDVDPFQGV